MVKLLLILITVTASLMISFLYLGIFFTVKKVITKFVAKVSAGTVVSVGCAEIASSKESKDET